MAACTLCPRRCGVDRARERGFCGMPEEAVVARAAPHFGEEPPVSGKSGSGTVFFCGCSLGCVFCQNAAIRGEKTGKTLSADQLADLFLRLAATGVHNLNLVTGTHFTDQIAGALAAVKPRLGVPVLWNSSGYETVETLGMLEGLVDVYMPDFKYLAPTLASICASAPDYAEVAAAAVAEMFRQVGPCRFDGNGLLTRGLLIRHLVLPGQRRDSMAILRRLAAIVPVESVRLSLLAQYTPDFAKKVPDAPDFLLRRVTRFEYDAVCAAASDLGFVGYSQARDSATAAWTPDFTDAGIL